MSIVAISGEDGSGKDVLAKLLFLQLNNRESFIPKFEELSPKIFETDEEWKLAKFGKPVAEQYKYYTGVDWYSLDRYQKELHREKFSVFAENMKTLFGSDIWVKKLDLSTNLIISDLRFKPELGFIKNYPNYTIKIIRDGTESHINKLKDYKDWDMIVDNNGSIEDLMLISKQIKEEVWKLQDQN